MDPILAQAAGDEDSSRYIRPTSELREHLYPGWYGGNMRDYLQPPTSPILSEFGAQALPSVEEMKAMVGESWPPDWQKMAYHDFQYDQTFNVAQIALGDSWEAFVSASQRYQADLLKLALERFRQAKYQPVGGIFQFMFMDCWPSVTWSVVSYERRPKAGYVALQNAYQPVLVGAQLGRTIWTPGAHQNREEFIATITPWTVNDLHHLFAGVELEVLLSSSLLSSEMQLQSISCDIPVDSAQTLAPLELKIPATLPDGTYVLRLRLHHQKEKLSENTYDIQIKRRA